MNHPTLPMPGGQKLETLMVCTDATCGRCFRCKALASVQAIREDSATFLHQSRALTALVGIQKEALRSVAARLEDDPDASVALLQVVDMSPEQALALLAPAPEDQQAKVAPEETLEFALSLADREIAKAAESEAGAPTPSFDLTSTPEDAAHE